jgi:hypothetical protein
MHGKMYWCGAYQNAFGFSVTNGSAGNITAGMGYANLGTVTLPDSSTVACGSPFFWVGDCAAFVKYNAGSLAVKGNITITGGSGVANFDEITSLGNAIGLKIGDNRAANCPPCSYPVGAMNEFKQSVCIGISGGAIYGNLETIKPWGDSSGGYATQTYKDQYGVWRRRAPAGATSWGPWYKETNDTGALVSRVIPTHAAAPGTGTGLFLGCDYMGYYNGSAWKTYMDNTGKFYLTGTNGGLAWNGTNLVVCGTVCATAGCFTGAVTATSGTFCGTVCATSGVFCGTICATAGSFSGCVYSCTGNLAGFTMSSCGICTNRCGACIDLRTWVTSCPGYYQSQLSMSANSGCASTGDGYGASTVRITAGNDGWGSGYAPLLTFVPSTGCYGFYTNGKIYVAGTTYTSDRLLKERITKIDILPRIRSLNISEWSFKNESQRHIGPMAQDFYQLFPFYSDSPDSIDQMDGIALKGVQELDGCVGCLQACICSLESRLANLEARLPACV